MIIILNWEFKMKNNFIKGQSFVPFVDGIFFKSIKTILISGKLDDDFQVLMGKNGIKNREFKNTIINKECLEASGIGIYKLKHSVEIIDNMGFVKLSSLLSGFNTNKNSNIKLKTKNIKFNNLLLGKLFRSPKNFIGKHLLEHITFDEAINKFESYFLWLLENYDNDEFISCSERKKNEKKI